MARARATLIPPCLAMSLLVLPRVHYWYCNICNEGMNSQAHIDFHFTLPAHHFSTLDKCGYEMMWCSLCGGWVLEAQAEHIRSASHLAKQPVPNVGYLGIRRNAPSLFITPEQRGQIFEGATKAFYRYHREVHFGWFAGDEPIYSSASEDEDELN